MAKVFGLKLNDWAVKAELNSGAVQSDLLSRAQAISAKASSFGPGKFVADVRPGKSRAHAMVKTGDSKAVMTNAKYNALLKALNAGRSG